MTTGKKRELLFSITAKDCEFQATRGSGKGGQHRNKVSTAIRCTHRPSGAVGYAENDKSQHRNKKMAFKRMAESKKMKEWIRLEAARCTGELAEIDAKVDKQMRPGNIRVDVHNDKGLWMEMNNEDRR